ncbi:fused MFS/spermidine synthase [Pseudothauera rhizosphaerae]|uniref:Spermidine synthase n=1 Tax=Pseudothauera rhizosphaerae TaxID=2565932 RepID=A0A4S4AAJ2_9RHOO|nr:fused MFS/spermidine synthase [Pseudothauera rhizosphaerae]THF55892.1 spermidine synthase [Pseudothauera rhizosphaerae]
MSTPIDISEEAGVRYLHFGSEWVQGAMRIRRPNALELAYTREMMAGLLLRDADAWPRTALVIGLGAASVTKFLYHHCPQARIQVVEIEPRVVAAAHQFFRLPDEDARLAIHVGDGAEYVLNTQRRFDYILVDGYDRNARAGVLDTLPFYQAVRARLTDSGLMAVNLFGRSRGYRASLERIITAFDDRAIAFPSCDSGNVVAFGAAGEAVELPLAELRERAQALKDRTGVDLLPTVTRLEQAGSLPGGRLVL